MEVCHETTNGNPFNPLVLMSSVGASGYIPVRNGKIPEHTHNLLNLNQEKEENLNTVIMSNVTESEMKHRTTRKFQEPKDKF
jgi:hypothetical protein